MRAYNPSVKRTLDVGTWARYALVALFLLGLSVRTYSVWIKGQDAGSIMHHPDYIVEGRSWAPDQYRILFPLIWQGVHMTLGRDAAQSLPLFVSIVLCYAVWMAVFRRESGRIVSAGVLLLALYGACSHWYHYYYRETFLDLMWVGLGFYMQPYLGERWRPWVWFAAISLLATLSRESWLFILMGTGFRLWAEAGSLRALAFDRRWRTVRAGLAMALIATLVAYVSVRGYFGPRDYISRKWTAVINVQHLMPWKYPAVVIGHGLWSAGNGLFVLFGLSLLMGNRRHLPFVLGFMLPTIVVTFILARWIETRIFFPCFALMLASMGGWMFERGFRGTA